jgi:hypothetical protein
VQEHLQEPGGRSILQLSSTGVSANDSAPGAGTNDSVPANPGQATPPPLPPPPPPPAEPSIVALPADIRTVSTAAELQQAVKDGVRDIEVVDHLDLRALQLVNNPFNLRPDGADNIKATHTTYAADNLRSIRVRLYLQSFWWFMHCKS